MFKQWLESQTVKNYKYCIFIENTVGFGSLWA